jgi:WD40 repeat protein
MKLSKEKLPAIKSQAAWALTCVVALLPALGYLAWRHQQFAPPPTPWHIQTSGHITLVAFWPDAHSLFLTRWSQSEDGSLSRFSFHALDIPSRRERAMWAAGDFTSLQIAPDNRTFLGVQNDGRARVWRIADEELSEPLAAARTRGKWLHDEIDASPQLGSVTAMAFSSDSRAVATGVSWKGIKVWDARSGALLRTLRVLSSIQTLRFSDDGQSLLVIAPTESGTFLSRWDIATGRELPGLSRSLLKSKDVNTLKLAPRGEWAASFLPGSNFGYVWNLKTNAVARSFNVQQDKIGAVAFSNDGKQLAICGAQFVRVFEFASGREKTIWHAPRPQDIESDDSIDGNGFVTNTVDIAPTNTTQNATFAPDGSSLAVELSDGSLKIWPLK